MLFGKDAYEPSEYPYYWRVFETNDEYFDYYRDYHAFWKLYGMGLPDAVLRKLYYQNALRVTPGLPQTGGEGTVTLSTRNAGSGCVLPPERRLRGVRVERRGQRRGRLRGEERDLDARGRAGGARGIDV